MQDDKKYTPQEVAIAVLKKCQEVYEKHNLAKANTAHEVEPGGEPSYEGSEAPEYLANADIENSDSRESNEPPKQMENAAIDEEDKDKKKKQKKYDGAMDENDDDEDKKEEIEDDQEDYNDETEDKDDDQKKYGREKKELGKSEKIEKKGKDRCWDGYEPVPGKKPYSEGSCRKETEKAEDLEKIHLNMKSEDGGMSVEDAVSKIMSDKYGVNDVMDGVHSSKRSKVLEALRGKDTKKAEMCKGYMKKCGEMERTKKVKKGEKLKKFMEKRKDKKGKKIEKYLNLGGTSTSAENPTSSTKQGMPDKPSPGQSIADKIGM